MFHTLDLILCWCLYWPYRHYRLQDMFPTLPIAGYFQAWTFLTWLSVALFPGLFKNLEKRDTYSLIVHELNYFTIVTWNYASQATIDPWRTSLLSEKPQNSFHSADSPQSTCHLRCIGYWYQPMSDGVNRTIRISAKIHINATVASLHQMTTRFPCMNTNRCFQILKCVRTNRS